MPTQTEDREKRFHSLIDQLEQATQEIIDNQHNSEFLIDIPTHIGALDVDAIEAYCREHTNGEQNIRDSVDDATSLNNKARQDATAASLTLHEIGVNDIIRHYNR